MEQNNEIKQLYERFKADLRSAAPDMYYDEDELISIFDIAGDYDDRYVRIQVLILGLRVFPESEQLELRVGLELVDGGISANLDDFLARNKHRNGVMWELLRVRGDHLNTADVIQRLEQILDRYVLDEDEAIIQFINIVEDFMLSDWLAANYRRVAERSKYQDTVLAESAECLRFTNPDVAIEISEELTRIDPFNAGAWIKLAELYLENEKYEDGLSAVEYAKAIDPENAYCLYLEGRILLGLDERDQHAIDLLEEALRRAPDLYAARAVLSETYVSQGRDKEAEDLWDAILEIDPDNNIALNEKEKLRKGIVDNPSMFLPNEFITEDILAERIEAAKREAMTSGDEESFEIPLGLLAAYDHAHGLYKLAGEYIKLLYRRGRLQQLCDFMERERPDDAPEMRFDPPSIPLYAASLLRLGRKQEAHAVAVEYLERTTDICRSTELKLAFAGVRTVLEYIRVKSLDNTPYDYNRDPVAESLI